MYPHLKVLFSFGGWTWSGGFGQAAANPTAFANSCYNLVEDPRWADVFDGIDIDWEYPNACGLTCDTSGFASFKNLMQALRGAVRPEQPGHRGDHGRRHHRRQDRRGRLRRRGAVRRLVHADDVRLLRRLGRAGPDRAALAADLLPGHPAGRASTPTPRSRSSRARASRRASCCSASASTAAAGPASPRPRPAARRPARRRAPTRPGIEDYKVLKTRCPATGTVAGTAYAYCGSQWWSYDTPAHHRRQDDLRQEPGPRRRVLLGASAATPPTVN